MDRYHCAANRDSHFQTQMLNPWFVSCCLKSNCKTVSYDKTTPFVNQNYKSCTVAICWQDTEILRLWNWYCLPSLVLSYNPELVTWTYRSRYSLQWDLPIFYSNQGSGTLQSDHLDRKCQVLNKLQLLYLYQEINDASTDPAGIREMRRLQWRGWKKNPILYCQDNFFSGRQLLAGMLHPVPKPWRWH